MGLPAAGGVGLLPTGAYSCTDCERARERACGATPGGGRVNRAASQGPRPDDDGPMAAEDYGLTAREQREGEALDARLAREEPDVAGRPAARGIREPSGATAGPTWNAVVTLRGEHFAEGVDALKRHGAVIPSPFSNVITMRVDDLEGILDDLLAALAADPHVRASVSRFVPLQHTFTFRSNDEFERNVAATSSEWTEDLAGKSFHVRVHRRGGDTMLDAADEAALVGQVVLDALEAAGTNGRVVFDDPDAVIDIETIDNDAGMSLWTRDDLNDYPFLRVE
jgi:tRNA(Ser,Leu) C12 N-acetylase TAN1